jgi:hypothetical protein
MAEFRERLSSSASGVFKVIVEGARKVKRALSEGHPGLPPEAQELGNTIAGSFMAGRFSDVHALGTPSLQQQMDREQFETHWREAVRDHGPFTAYEVSDAGPLEIGFVPGLEAVPQAQFVGFVEIAFASAEVAVDDDQAFVIEAVVLDADGELRLGALHRQ